jgi:hypothetical protein
MAFLQQFINISLMQCPGNNEDNIINHVPVPVNSITLLGSNYFTRAGNVNLIEENIQRKHPNYTIPLTLCTARMLTVVQ